MRSNYYQQMKATPTEVLLQFDYFESDNVIALKTIRMEHNFNIASAYILDY